MHHRLDQIKAKLQTKEQAFWSWVGRKVKDHIPPYNEINIVSSHFQGHPNASVPVMQINSLTERSDVKEIRLG